jgi:hypothetical protein
MATRRTTMRSRTGTKLYAVRDESGRFEDIQTYKRAHAADMRHESKAEKEAAQGPIEKRVRKTATDAVRSVKSSVKGAVAAVGRAAKRVMKKASGPRPAVVATPKAGAKKTAGKPAAKNIGKSAGRKTTAKPAARKRVKKAARKSAAKRT